MKVIGMYLKQRFYTILSLMFFSMVFIVIFILYTVPIEPIIYAFEVSCAIVILYSIYDFSVFLKKYKRVNECLMMKEVTALDIEESHNPIVEQYQQLAYKLLQEKKEIYESSNKSMRDMKDYYAMWAHQIKTPIAAANLTLQIMETDNNVLNLKQEMFKIDFYVDAVMNYLRLENMSSDYEFKAYNIETIVKRTVRKFATQFIGRHISVKMENLDEMVYTDSKWLGFIIEQLISNSIKYTNEGGCVSIYMLKQKRTVLVIEDNGIGISPEDIPRIMERGFTGYNGRIDKNSSGIGLYLVKKAADKLGMTITFDSDGHRGTKVFIDMTQKHLQHE